MACANCRLYRRIALVALIAALVMWLAPIWGARIWPGHG